MRRAAAVPSKGDRAEVAERFEMKSERRVRFDTLVESYTR